MPPRDAVWLNRCLRTPTCAPHFASQRQVAEFWRRATEVCGSAPHCELIDRAVQVEGAALERQTRRWFLAQADRQAQADAAAAERPPLLPPERGIVQVAHLEAQEVDSPAFAREFFAALEAAAAHATEVIVAFAPRDTQRAYRAQALLFEKSRTENWLIAEEEWPAGPTDVLPAGKGQALRSLSYGLDDPLLLAVNLAYSLLEQIDGRSDTVPLIERLGMVVAHSASVGQRLAAACEAVQRAELDPLCAALRGPGRLDAAALRSQWLTLRNTQKIAWLRAFLRQTADTLRGKGLPVAEIDAYLDDPTPRQHQQFQAVIMGVHRVGTWANNLRKLQRAHPHRRRVAFVGATHAALLRQALDILQLEALPPEAAPGACPAADVAA